MSDIDQFFSRANGLIDRLESLLPDARKTVELNASPAIRWRCKGNDSWLEPIENTSKVQLEDLKCIDRQKSVIVQNTRQFIQGLPANNVLLWGPRGTGKSSLIKAILDEYKNDGLRLIEVERQYLVDLLDICDLLQNLDGRFIIFCDDLSFEADDPSYKALKVILDGSLSTTPDNILIYTTSNRRHLIPEYMNENQRAQMVEGELHLNEATEEKISLSERFGLWLSFHPFNQDQYLIITDHWLNKLNAPIDDRKTLHKLALRWALEHGSRSGRTAWQFARDWTGKKLLEEQKKP
ncbi:MAG: ATP-binding protein [Gammaproteobacteria bacterium]